ncbi:MAG: chorismate mutase [Lachnospiraceae bacterium]|nr:chorismate mutase [Lachnospiraceae bacterium]
MKDLKEIRKSIDGTDEKIAGLFEKRMELSAAVAETKIGTGGSVFVPEREKEKLERIKSLLSDSGDREEAEALFRYIMILSRFKQYGMMLPAGDPAAEFEASGSDDVTEAPAADTFLTETFENDIVEIRFELPEGTYPLSCIFAFLQLGGIKVLRSETGPAGKEEKACRVQLELAMALEDARARTAILAISEDTKDFRILGIRKGGAS